MYRIVYLSSNGDYALLYGDDHTTIYRDWEILEKAENKIITIYDYYRNVQLYRCDNYDYHRKEFISYLLQHKTKVLSHHCDSILA